MSLVVHPLKYNSRIIIGELYVPLRTSPFVPQLGPVQCRYIPSTRETVVPSPAIKVQDRFKFDY